MESVNVVNVILSILAGLSTCIPLVIQLIKYVKAAIKEKNFEYIMDLVLDLIPEAEEKFSTGAERKKYIMSNIESLSSILHYEVDLDRVSEMIDTIVKLSKKVNVKKR